MIFANVVKVGRFESDPMKWNSLARVETHNLNPVKIPEIRQSCSDNPDSLVCQPGQLFIDSEQPVSYR
jgi:hypothetical protein